MLIFGEDGQVNIVRQPLQPPWQGVYDQGTIYIDPSVPHWGIDEIVNQIQHKLIGNDHLAPNTAPYRPGRRHLHLAHSDSESDEGRGVG